MSLDLFRFSSQHSTKTCLLTSVTLTGYPSYSTDRQTLSELTQPFFVWMSLHVCATRNSSVFLSIVIYSCFQLLFLSVGSLHSFGLPSCRNCELVSTSSPSQPHFGLGDRTTTTTTTTNVTNSSLGLLQLLQEHGISASPFPHHNLHHSQSTKPAHPTAKDKGGGSSPDKVGRRNFFSLNLVEKLQSLGLHRVAAWGMKGRNNAERENKLHIV